MGTFRYYVVYVSQGVSVVYGSRVVELDRRVETEADIGELKRKVGAKDEDDQHIVILNWKPIE